MRARKLLSSLAVSSLVLSSIATSTGCTPRVLVPDEERVRASRELEGQLRYLRVAAYAAPFFGDDTKLLLSDAPLETLDLLEKPDGTPIAPPPAERVLLPGTAVRIEKIEFPTGWMIARRMITTPRYHPWIYLTLAGEPRPLMVVLSQRVATADAARVELERVLGTSDTTRQLQALPEFQRNAIAQKRLVAGMPAFAIEMSWGLPSQKVIDRPSNSETWSWSDGRRAASLQSGRLTTWTIGNTR